METLLLISHSVTEPPQTNQTEPLTVALTVSAADLEMIETFSNSLRSQIVRRASV